MAPNYRVLLEKANEQIRTMNQIIINQNKIIETFESLEKTWKEKDQLSEKRIAVLEELTQKQQFYIEEQSKINFTQMKLIMDCSDEIGKLGGNNTDLLGFIESVQSSMEEIIKQVEDIGVTLQQKGLDQDNTR